MGNGGTLYQYFGTNTEKAMTANSQISLPIPLDVKQLDVETRQQGGRGKFLTVVPISWHCFLFVLTLIVGLGQSALAQAEEIGLNFDLVPTSRSIALSQPQEAESHKVATTLPIELTAQTGNAPIATTIATTTETKLPPPPPQPALLPRQPSIQRSPNALPKVAIAPALAIAEPNTAELSFDLSTAKSEQLVSKDSQPSVSYFQADSQPQQTALSSVRPALFTPSSPISLDPFVGGSDSLVAKAVGTAEGTRTPEGHRTPAYYGHTDPGNGARNLGTFSYQHAAHSPEDADAKQLSRLQKQAANLQVQAETVGLELTLAERLNGIDLANQSPRAALDREGYIDRLAQAHQMRLQGSEAILWARTRSFLDPDSQRWNAPGLGNNVHSITHDQQRRQRAIDLAITMHQMETISASPTAIDPEIASSASESPAIEQLLSLDLSSDNPRPELLSNAASKPDLSKIRLQPFPSGSSGSN
jgi:hypothetical protein